MSKLASCRSGDLSLMNGGATLIGTCINNAAGSWFPTGNMTATCLEASGIRTSCAQCMSSVVDEFGSCVTTACDSWSSGFELPTTVSSKCKTCVSNLNDKYGPATSICGIDPNGLPGNLWSSTCSYRKLMIFSLQDVVTTVLILKTIIFIVCVCVCHLVFSLCFSLEDLSLVCSPVVVFF